MKPAFLSRPVAGLWVSVIIVFGALYMTLPPSPDQSQFDWMAFIARSGHPFYVGSFDMNWPGAMWLHELGQSLFGVHAWTWRLTDFLLMLGFSSGIALFLRRNGWHLAAKLFLFAYPALYITAGGWMAGQRDIMATGFLFLAALMIMPGRRHELAFTIGAGLMVAAAVLIRPTFLSFIGGLIILEWLPLASPQSRRTSRMARTIAVMAGLTLGILIAAIAGLALGSLDDWYQQSVEFALSIYVKDPPQDWKFTLYRLFILSWHWITVLAALGLLAWFKRSLLGYGLALVLGIAATSVLSFIVQDKGFAYHLAGLLAVLVLFMAIAFDQINQLRTDALSPLIRSMSALALAAFALLALAGTGSKLLGYATGANLILSGDLGPTAAYNLTEDERREILGMIRSQSTAADTVAVYGTQYELPYRAQRLPTYRYFTPAADQINDSFAHTEAWLEEIDDGLRDTPPAFVILDRSFLSGTSTAPQAANPNALILSRLLAHLQSGYDLVFENDTILVFQRPS